MVEAYVTGASLAQLARQFGAHTDGATLARQARCACSAVVAFTDAQEREVVRLYVEERRSLAEIAPVFGVSAGAVRKVLVRRGVERRAQVRRSKWVTCLRYGQSRLAVELRSGGCP